MVDLPKLGHIFDPVLTFMIETIIFLLKLKYSLETLAYQKGVKMLPNNNLVEGGLGPPSRAHPTDTALGEQKVDNVDGRIRFSLRIACISRVRNT